MGYVRAAGRFSLVRGHPPLSCVCLPCCVAFVCCVRWVACGARGRWRVGIGDACARVVRISIGITWRVGAAFTWLTVGRLRVCCLFVFVLSFCGVFFLVCSCLFR